jgi:hypothetical protein
LAVEAEKNEIREPKSTRLCILVVVVVGRVDVVVVGKTHGAGQSQHWKLKYAHPAWSLHSCES